VECRGGDITESPEGVGEDSGNRVVKRKSHLAWALAYARIGWPVFPSHGKKPLRGSHGWRDASTDEAKIRKWWGRRPEADVSLAAGYTFMALDVDPDHGGEESLAKLEGEHGELPLTVVQLSGGGGRHILFKPVAGLRNIAGGQTKWWPYRGLDIRSLGAALLATPSVHPVTGALYEWLEGQGPQLPLAEAPGWLVARMTPPPEPEVKVIPISDPERQSIYVARALEKACTNIASAPFGTQRMILNTEAFCMGGYVNCGQLDRRTAESSLIAAGLRMPSEPNKTPWNFASVAQVVRNGISDGINRGRQGEKIPLHQRKNTA
jgi:hypothetical protein